MNRKLMELVSGKFDRLAISMPPRHGKSVLVSHMLPAWFLGMFPDRRVIFVSYEADYAKRFGQMARDVLIEHGHRFGVEVDPKFNRAAWWGIKGHNGYMATAGMGGAVTGKGGELVIIDDPVKNSDEAKSKVYRDRNGDFYHSTLKTRLEPGGKTIIVQTRWHQDDLMGRLLRDEGDKWEQLTFPAIAHGGDVLGRKEGEALWPERYDLSYLKIAKASNPVWYEAMYQQNPVPKGGGLFRKQWFRYWNDQDEFYLLDEPVRKSDCFAIATVDLAISEKQRADYTVIQTWMVSPKGDMILVDMIRARLNAYAIRRAIKANASKWSPSWTGIESVQFQEAIVQDMKRVGLTIKRLKTRGADKVSRAQSASVRMEAGSIYFPVNPSWKSDMSDMEMEMLTFPSGIHDDTVDAMAYAAIEVGKTFASLNVEVAI